MRKLSRRGAAFAILCLIHAAPTAASDALWLSGAESTTGSAAVRLERLAPLPGNRLGSGWISRLGADWTRYEYEKGGVIHDARGPGLEAGLGYGQSGDVGWWSVSSGLVYRRTRVSPDDPDSRVDGDEVGLKVRAEAEKALQLAPVWRLGGDVSYVFGQRAYWARGRLMRDLPAGQRVGVETIAQGNPDYRARQVGFVFGLRLAEEVELGFKLGIRKARGLDAAGYFGVELGRSF